MCVRHVTTVNDAISQSQVTRGPPLAQPPPPALTIQGLIQGSPSLTIHTIETSQQAGCWHSTEISLFFNTFFSLCAAYNEFC